MPVVLQAGKKDQAVALFTSLRDDAGTPTTLREYMREVVQHLAPGNDKQVSDKKAGDEQMSDKRVSSKQMAGDKQ